MRVSRKAKPKIKRASKKDGFYFATAELAARAAVAALVHALHLLLRERGAPPLLERGAVQRASLVVLHLVLCYVV